jgi:hypothetical protein
MKSFLFVAVIAGTLALFNPTTDDFGEFIRERTEDVVSETARAEGERLFGEVTGGLTGQVTGALARGAVERRSFVLFSHYTLDFDGPRNDAQEWTFVGVGGQFFELHKPAALVN